MSRGCPRIILRLDTTIFFSAKYGFIEPFVRRMTPQVLVLATIRSKSDPSTGLQVRRPASLAKLLANSSKPPFTVEAPGRAPSASSRLTPPVPVSEEFWNVRSPVPSAGGAFEAVGAARVPAGGTGAVGPADSVEATGAVELTGPAGATEVVGRTGSAGVTGAIGPTAVLAGELL